MTPETLLGPALAGAVRDLVREELQRVGAAAAPASTVPELLSPAQASKRLNGRPGEDTIRKWIAAGRITPRLNNLSKNPRRPNYLVTIEEVLAAMAGAGRAPEVPEAVDLEAARARARERAGKARGGR